MLDFMPKNHNDPTYNKFFLKVSHTIYDSFNFSVSDGLTQHDTSLNREEAVKLVKYLVDSLAAEKITKKEIDKTFPKRKKAKKVKPRTNCHRCYYPLDKKGRCTKISCDE